MPASTRPRVVVLAPAALFESFFGRETRNRLSRFFRCIRVPGRALTGRLRSALHDADALITTWDSPRFGEDLLRLAPRLRVIGHCGGEVKGRFPAALFSRLTITNAPAPMAPPVAELAVALLLYSVRNVDAYRGRAARALERDLPAPASRRRWRRDAARTSDRAPRLRQDRPRHRGPARTLRGASSRARSLRGGGRDPASGGDSRILGPVAGPFARSRSGRGAHRAHARPPRWPRARPPP